MTIEAGENQDKRRRIGRLHPKLGVGLQPDMIAAGFAALTIGFFMYITVFPIECHNRWSAYIVLALGAAFSFGIMSGDAALRGKLPTQIISAEFQRSNPLVTAITGGAAMFFLVFVITTPILSRLAPCADTLPPGRQSVNLPNPFGEQQVLLDGRAILITSETLEASKAKDDQFVSIPKFLFQLRKPDKQAGFDSEMISAREYADLLAPKTQGGNDFFSTIERLTNAVDNVSFLRDAKVFRLFKREPIVLEFDNASLEGPRASKEEIAEARKERIANLRRQLKNAAELQRLEKKDQQQPNVAPGGDPDLTELEKWDEAHSQMLGDIKAAVPFFNELSILIVDKRAFERALIAGTRGRKIEATPLQFMMSAGGILPKFDIQSVKQASVSANNRVWGFYGRSQWHNVKLRGVLQEVVNYDFYRLYVFNNEYLYQITVSYIPHVNQPRDTWDALVGALQSLRIVF